jgi:hypothetical protein
METFSHIFGQLEKIASCYARVEAADDMVKEATRLVNALTGAASAGGKAVARGAKALAHQGTKFINKLHSGIGGTSLLNKIRFNRMGLPELRGKVLSEENLRRILALEFKQFNKLENFAPGEILKEFKILRRAANKGIGKRNAAALGFKPHGKPVNVKAAPTKTTAQPAPAAEPVATPTKPVAAPAKTTAPAAESATAAPTKTTAQPAPAAETVAPQPKAETVAASNTGNTAAPKSNTSGATTNATNAAAKTTDDAAGAAAKGADDAAGTATNGADDAAGGLTDNKHWWKWLLGGTAGGYALHAMTSPHAAPQNYEADSNAQYVNLR